MQTTGASSLPGQSNSLSDNRVPTERFRSMLDRLPEEFEPPPAESPRGRILAAAKRLFAEAGFAATSIRAIAESSQVNLAMVHYYFGSKEELYRLAIVTELINAFRKVRDGLPENLTPAELILLFPVRIAGVMRDNPVWMQLVRRELAEGAPNIAEVFQRMGIFGPSGFKSTLAEALAEAIQDGTLRAVKPEALFPLLITAGYGIVLLEPMLKIVTGREIQDDAVWEERMTAMSALFRDGLLLKGEGNL